MSWMRLNNRSNIVDKTIVLFSGAGGVGQGLRQLGLESTGLEIWHDAVHTARINKHQSIEIDVSSVSPSVFTEGLQPFLLQASPPCQGLSTAGKRTGRKDIENILLSLQGHDVDFEHEASHLIVGIKEWLDLSPEIIMLEQVQAIEPVWNWYANYLEYKGYNVWNQKVYMEQYGLAQTRTRSILIARQGKLYIPEPTYNKFNGWSPEKYTGVTMQNVLPHWAGTDIGFPRKYDGIGKSLSIDNIAYRARDFRNASMPSFALTEKARSWKRNNSLIDINEAKLLQGFNQDYQFTGTRTSQYLQLANSVPPHIVATLLQHIV